MAKNEGTVTIPIDRYLELTKFVDDVVAKDTMYIYSTTSYDRYIVIDKGTFAPFLDEINKNLEEKNLEFERHNSALQERIADFNKKPWYQRVFKSKV
jgi:malate synthase